MAKGQTAADRLAKQAVKNGHVAQDFAQTTERKSVADYATAFLEGAPNLVLTVNGMGLMAEPRKFSTGSLGWNFNGKAPATGVTGQRKEAWNVPHITLKLGEQEILATSKRFSTGSVGWYANGKVLIEVAGVQAQFQVGINVTVVGSKDLPANAVVGSRLVVQVGGNVTMVGSKLLAQS
jgi:hypothetical protein